MKTPREKALKIIQNLKKKGYTLEFIARSLADPKNNYNGPTLWTIQRALSGQTKLSATIANRILEVHLKGKR